MQVRAGTDQDLAVSAPAPGSRHWPRCGQVLDKALLRPGRFDNQVEVGKPDVKGRREILGLYMSKIKHDDSIDVESIASRTTGFAGADLQVSYAFFLVEGLNYLLLHSNW